MTFIDLKEIKIIDSSDFDEIEFALKQGLYVPPSGFLECPICNGNIQFNEFTCSHCKSKLNGGLTDYNLSIGKKLRPHIISELMDYIKKCFRDEKYQIKFFIANAASEVSGFVMSMIHPTYTSYGRKCGTFGWLTAHSYEVCRELIKNVENHMRENKVKKLRGNINFPKGLGGLGIQSEGFNVPLLYGVGFNAPKTHLIDFLRRMGFKAESEYISMEVTQKEWGSGRVVDENIRLGYYTIEEFWKHKDDFHSLISQSFQGTLPMPDTSGRNRLGEIIHSYERIPKSHFGVNTIKDYDPYIYTKIPAFQEALNNSDLNKCIMGAPLAFDRDTGDLVGAILAIPNIYQGLLDQPINWMNVDTVMVNKNYAGKGIFSALNNLGQIGTFLNGITHFEGTYIWNNNSDAIKSIFPHGKMVRKFYVMQKRIKIN